MTREIKRLYLFYLFNGLALAVIANGAFLDRLLLRKGLSLAQFGLAKGVATFDPLTVNLLLTPTIARLGLHGRVAGSGMY